MDKKKALKNLYKQTLRTMGVYEVRNLTNEKVLIGSTMNLDGSINRHKFELKSNSHKNKKLQNDWNDIGEKNFSFEVIEELLPRENPDYNYQEDLECLEDLWLEKLMPYNEKGYNERKKTRGERLQMIAANKRVF